MSNMKRILFNRLGSPKEFIIFDYPKYKTFLIMRAHKLTWIVVAFFILTTFRVTAQITANPSFTGCIPFSIVLSGPSGATAPFWTFGTSMGTSTLSSPNPIYLTPGTYNVTYTAMIGANPVTYTAQVVVYLPPTGNFIAILPSSHCEPMTVSFVGSGGSSGSTYLWAFGDLSSIGSGASVTHTYVGSNVYQPVMTIVDAVSTCTALASTTVMIPVSSVPVVTISSSNGFVTCAPPFTTNIGGSGSTSGSPLGGGLNYNWSFNSGSPATSNVPNPGIITFGGGQHTITLQVTDNNQCSGTGTTGVSVSGPSLTASLPGTICINSPLYGTVTSNQSSVQVNVQGSSISTLVPINPNLPTFVDTFFIMTAPGIQTIELIVQVPGCPAYSITQTVFVEEITPNFVASSPSITCQPSITTTYTNLSTINSSSSLTFTWEAVSAVVAYNQGVPTTSIISNFSSPTFTFSQGGVNPYTIYYAFSPVITLYVQSNSMAHCKAKIIQSPNTILRPTAWFLKDKRQGCAPLTVNFFDYCRTSIDFPITSYTWCNGATPPTYSTGTMPPPPANIPVCTFTYNNPGVYYPYLIIQTAGGCGDISFFDTVTVVNPPQVTASFPASACAGESVTIHMNGNITPAVSTSTVMEHWHIDTDNGFFSGCTTNPAPTFSFTHLGIHTVVVTGYQANCEGTATMVPTILIKGPIGKFRYETTCTGNKKVVTFTVHLQEASSAVLDFGDLSQQTITGNATGTVSAIITHTYLTTGDFTGQLSSSNTNGCGPYHFKQTIKVRDPKAVITFKGAPMPTLPVALACTKSPYYFSADNSLDNNLNCGKSFVWFYQAPTYTLAPFNAGVSSFTTSYQPTGLPDPKKDTLYIISDPIAKDTFRYAGTYTIGLMVKDINGCTDIQTIPFRISEAEPVFSFTANPACLSNGQIQLNNTTQAGQVSPDAITNYTWSFGDGTPVQTSTLALFNPTHTYYNTGIPTQTFFVMGIAVNNVGCRDTAIKVLQINNPNTSFLVSDSNPCLQQNSSTNLNFVASAGYATYSVSFGEPPGQPGWTTMSNFNNVYHGYSTPGVYHTTLTVIDDAGCKASESLNINVIGQPTAGILFPPSGHGICIGEQPVLTSNSSLYVTPITNFIWSIGSISTPLPGSPTLQTSYVVPVTTVSLTVSMTSLQLCPSTATAQVFMYNPIATAVIEPTVFCLGDNIKASIRIDGEVQRWQWFFGDFVQQPMRIKSSPFTSTTEPYAYTTFPTSGSNGSTTVTLTYYATTDDNNTCKRYDYVPIRVIKVQSDFKHLTDTYSHCLKLGDTFTNTSVNFPELNLAYDWDFGDQVSGNGARPSHTYAQAGVFNVTLTVRDVDYGCKHNSVKQMTVFPLPTATITAQSTTCPDTPFFIKGQADPGVSGIVTGTLIPAINASPLVFTSANTFSTMGSLSQSSTIFLSVTDNNTCVNSSPTVNVLVQDPVPSVHWDTSVVVGQTVMLNADLGKGFTYTWTPLVDYLNCSECFIHNPVSTSTINITYSVSAQDSLRCSVGKNTYAIHIIPKISLDVPTAFTPNGDGINDIIYPSGWGLRKLNFFKVFNRWGQLVFESNDLKIGWDGVFQGVPQNMETYVYQVSAETYLDKEPTLTKSGTFKLIR